MEKIVKILIAVIFLVCVSVTAFAVDLEKLIGYSGFIVNNSGDPINSSQVKLTFSIYETDTGGTALWTEIHDPVNVIDGEFYVNLGETVDFINQDMAHPNYGEPLFSSNAQYWLGIKIKVGALPEEPFEDRKKLLFVPYALRTEIETRTNDPSSPVTGQMWLRTDL